jgi:predicted chitinase/Ca2+-binding EF-hand superfamily protein
LDLTTHVIGNRLQTLAQPAAPAVPAPAPAPMTVAPAPAPVVDEWVVQLPLTPPVAIPVAPAPVPTPVPVAPAPQPAPAPVAPPKVYAPRKGRTASPKAAFDKLDKNDSGQLSRAELTHADAGVKKFDRNGDKAVSEREFKMGRFKQASFAGLDRDRDGVLKGQEIAQIVSPAGSPYDFNGDAQVTKKEFLKGREQDERATRPGPAKREEQAAKRQKRTNAIFKLADENRDGVLKGAERRMFKAYDANGNGVTSRKEFGRGQAADRERAEKGLRLEGKTSESVAKRLRQDRLGEKKAVPKPAPFIDPTVVAKLLGSPVENVKRSLPAVVKALREAGITDKASLIAAIATIRTEVGSFMPIHEYGGPSYWANYNGRSDLGNRPGTNDGVVYHGRGFIQLTGRANYGTYGRAIGENLVKNPNKALQPRVAAKVLVEYFKGRGIPQEAREGDWLTVRKAVNGGTNGWDTFRWAVGQLKNNQSWFKK